MGERVVIGREPPLAQEAPPGPSSAPPLNYGRSGGRFEGFWRDLNAYAQAAGEATSRASILAWPYVKAWWRQAAFALGLGFALAGLGDCIHSRYIDASPGVLLMFLGGVLIGISVRVPMSGSGDAKSK